MEEDKEALVKIEIKWYHANWCAPCRIMKPIIMDIAKSGEVDMTTVDVDQDEVDIDIMAIPTTRFYKGGEMAYVHLGVMSKGAIEGKILELKKEV